MRKLVDLMRKSIDGTQKKRLYSVHTKNHHDVRRFGLFWMCVNCRRVINGYTSCLKIQLLTSTKHLKNVQIPVHSFLPNTYQQQPQLQKHVRIEWFPPIHQFKSIFLIVSIYGDFHNLTNWRKKILFGHFHGLFFLSSYFTFTIRAHVLSINPLNFRVQSKSEKLLCCFYCLCFLLDFKLKFSSFDWVSKTRREAPSL